MSQKMKKTVERLFNEVENRGATADLIVDQSNSLSLKARCGDLEEHKVSSSQIFGLRVVKDNRVGTAYSEADDEEALISMVDQALINASYSKENQYERILDNNSILRSDDEHFCPEDTATVDDKINTILTLEKDLLSRDKIKSLPYNGLAEGLSSRQIFSTAGLDAAIRSRYSMLYAYGLAEDGDKNAMEGESQIFRLSRDFSPGALADEVHKNCLAMLEGREVASGRYDIIFDRECLIQLFGIFSMAFSGKSAKDGISPWRSKVGQKVADKRLNFSDQPLLKDGFGYQLFDAEGTATEKTSLIVDGNLQSLIHNSATAAYFNVKTTGHAVRGPKSTLGVGSHQLVIDAGTTTDAELKSGQYLLLTGLTGLHSGANAISGDFSFGASGYLIKDGQVQQAVRGITVAGNFYSLLHQINCIGDEQMWNKDKSALLPLIRFADMAVSGK